MPTKHDLVSQIAAQTAEQISSGPGAYLDFLTTAANNYKYHFREQLLIFAQKPEATACAEMATWNKLGRWVNRGAKGIALLDDASGRNRVRYVFDLSDTNSRQGFEVRLWKMQERYEAGVIEALGNSFGELEDHESFALDLIALSEQLVEDNLSDYVELLESSKENSLLEEVDALNTRVWLGELVKSTVGFMALTRCGIDARQFYDASAFSHLRDFNTYETISVLGEAGSDIAEMMLREIEVTVRAMEKAERKNNRTFAFVPKIKDNRDSNQERRPDYGTDLSTGGGLSPSGSERTGKPEAGQVRDAETGVSEDAPQTDLHWDAAFGQAEPAPGGDRPAGRGDDGTPDPADGPAGGRDGEPEGSGPDGLGAEDEQHRPESRGSGAEFAGLQLSGHDFDKPTDIDYYFQDEEKQELIRNSDALKDHRQEIAAFFEAHPDRKERGDFLRSFFNSTFTESILSNGQQAGYRAYVDVLHLWRGHYPDREREEYLRWESVASTVYGMMLLDEWLSPEERPFPSEGQQISMIQETQAEKENGFTIPQAAIDYVLTGGSQYSESKYRIYEQFQKNEEKDANIRFLKNEYGTGGHSDAIPGTGFWEDHEPGKGIIITKRYSPNAKGEVERVVLSWAKVEKRIRELIAADRYLNDAEKARYPEFLQERADRQVRSQTGTAIRRLILEYNTYLDGTGQQDEKVDAYELNDLVSALDAGRKAAIIGRGLVYVLPALRSILDPIAEGAGPVREQAKALLAALSTEVFQPMEPTEEELSRPAPKREYRLAEGDHIYLGAEVYEIIFMGTETVTISDVKFPLMQEQRDRDELFRMVAENPMNDRFLHLVEEPEQGEPQKFDLGFGTAGNGLSVWNRLDEVNGDYRTIAHIHADRSITFTFNNLPEEVKDQIREVAASSEMSLSETQDIPVFDTPSPLSQAKEYIDAFCRQEYGEDGDYSDLHRVPLAYTTTEDEDLPIEVFADLLENRLLYVVDEKEVCRLSCGSLEELNEYLAALDFSELVSRAEEEYAAAQEQEEIEQETTEQGESRVDELHQAITVLHRQAEREDADFTDPTKIALFYMTVGDPIRELWVTVNEPENTITFQSEDGFLHTIGFVSPNELTEYLQGNDFESMASYAEKLYEQWAAKREQHSSEASSESRVDEMLRQAELAAQLYEETGQAVFGFEEGDPNPVNVPAPVTEQPEKETLAPPKPRLPAKLAPFLPHPEIEPERRLDYRITNDRIGEGTPLERFYHNRTAIQLLRKLESEDRLANSYEQAVLADYVGWGGLAEFFEESHPHHGELLEVLSGPELDSARESTLTAFYTPPVIIRAMYRVLENMGFQSGNILEPSCGIGNFMGMKPDSLGDSKFYGVELDNISGRIARQLYQNASIAIQGFEKTDLPDSFFDVAIGNIPFGNFKLSDRSYDKHNFLIHDYFFAKTLDMVRPGGIIAFVTSKGTLDKESPVVRKYLAQRADLLGAVRLPNDTFKAAAGTEVTSDILFLQKRDTLLAAEPDWVHLNVNENGMKMNQYFIDHPEMVLGEMKEVSGPFGPETACVPYDGQDLGELLSEAIQNITGSISEYEIDAPDEEEEDLSIPADPTVRNFSYTLVEGKLYYRENSRMNPVDVSVTASNRIKGMVSIRDCVRELIEFQTEDYPAEMIQAKQQELNLLYDAFSAKYGLINDRANKSVFSMDNAYFLLSSLEVLDEEGKFLRKADMFTRRTIKQRTVVTHVDTGTEALAISLAEKARVDMAYMSELTGKDEPQLYEELKGVIFLNPLYGYGNDTEAKYLTADEYLSGNVREKLQWARRSAELAPEDFTVNVEALERVQPVDLTAAEISVRLGTTWIPPEDYADFMFELLGTPRYLQWHIKVHFSQFTGEWNIEGKSTDRANIKATNTYGTDRINAYKIIEQSLNLKDVRIFDYVEDADGKRVAILNKKETAIAQAKQEAIKQAFQEWIWEDPERRDRLTRLYNERFNSIRPREYDGSHLSLTGINPEITLRQHQLNAVARGLYGGNELLGHVVGAGKTFTMVAIAQESKRLGLCNKSLIVVPNHLTEQWASEYLQLYPSANILVATAKDFETKNRKRFCGRIATGDYDAVIIGHSQLEKIPLSIERQTYLLEQQLEEIMDGILEMKENRGDKFSIKQLERSKKQVQAKLDKLNDQSRKDDVVTFEELGVDRLFIDEAHYYKNLAAFTKMRNVGGISQTEAMKSSDLYMKCRYLDELTGGKGVIFATGTPISNTMVEMYTMQKYLQYDALQRNDLIHFDSWASTFGETVTAIELAPEGTGYRAKTRFAKFFNLPELMNMFKEVADIQTADMLNLPVPKVNYHTVALKPSEYQKEMVDGLAERAEKVRSGMVNSSQDNMLVITNDGRKLALDQRLMNEMLPESDTGKVSVCAQNVYDIWQRTAEQRSTQMVFCDLSTPHNDGHFNVYDAIRDKLMELGVPAEEIAYIHSAGTEVKKKELFGKVRSGQIRVLIGSTQKMGAGTNVQTKLIALHHLDCPWRPADLQQREGRIVRQGNENPEVEIYTYVTENTFDAYLYQLVESKQKFIGQIMTSKSPVRSAEDIDETALSYAEIKALCSGNPQIKEKMDLDVAVAKLKLLKANHLSQRYALEDKILKEFPSRMAHLERRIEGFQTDMATLERETHPNEDGFSPMVVFGQVLTEKKEAGSRILEASHNMTSPDPIVLGSYRGFEMELFFDSFSKEYRINLKGELTHQISLSTDLYGNIQRMDNELGRFGDRLTQARQELESVKQQLENAKQEMEKPFPQEDELKEKSARLDELNILLNMDQPHSEMVDDDDRDSHEPEREAPGMER